jgi:hypothetical protein
VVVATLGRAVAARTAPDGSSGVVKHAPYPFRTGQTAGEGSSTCRRSDRGGWTRRGRCDRLANP